MGTALMVVTGHLRGLCVLRRAFASADEEAKCLDGTDEIILTRRLRGAVRALSLAGNVLVAGVASGAVLVMGVAFTAAGRQLHCQTLARLHAADEVLAPQIPQATLRV